MSKSKAKRPSIETSDMYDDFPAPSPRLTRKSRVPKPDSLAGFIKDYMKLGFKPKQASALGQLAYAQKTILRRLGSLEAISLAQMLGAVDIDGDIHNLSCARRDDRKSACDCGAVLKVKGKENPGCRG